MKPFLSSLFVVGACMTLFGAAVYITHWAYAPFVYAIGALSVFVAQVFSYQKSDNFKIRRLRRQQIFGGLFLVVGGLCMFFTHGNEWIACLTIGAVLLLYTSFRIPSEESKEKGDAR